MAEYLELNNVCKRAESGGFLLFLSAPWHSQPAAQIDLIIERADQLTNVCEVKYSEFPYSITKNEEARLRNRMGSFLEETQTRKALHLTLITTFGVKKNTYSDSVRNEITMDDLFL